jgi:methyl coenzyme M reductase subunit D
MNTQVHLHTNVAIMLQITASGQLRVMVIEMSLVLCYEHTAGQFRSLRTLINTVQLGSSSTVIKMRMTKMTDMKTEIKNRVTFEQFVSHI